MMYPYMTLDDDTEIVHSELKEDGTVKVYIETPDTKGGFYNASCILPDGKWIDVVGYSESKMDYFKQLIKNNTQMVMKSAKESLANERWLMESKAQLEKGKVIAVETKYLESIPWMTESLIEGKKSAINDCLTEDEIEW